MSSPFIGMFIRTERIARKMSQKQLAEKVGYKSPGTISNIELGFQLFPISKTQDFEKALGIEDGRLIQVIRNNHPLMKTLTLFEAKAPIKPRFVDDKTQVFDFKGHDLTIITDAQGNPWWVAKEVCDVLGLSNVGQALSALDDDEKNTIIINDGIPGNPTKLIINESGLYSLILRSRKPEAKAFKRWITHDVLPTIRKTGRYEIKPAEPRLLPGMTEFEAQLLEKVTEAAGLAKAEFFKMQSKLVEKHKLTIAANKILLNENQKMKDELETLKNRGTVSNEDLQKARNWDALCESYKGQSIYNTAKIIGVPPKQFHEYVMTNYFGKDKKPYAKWMESGKNYFAGRFKKADEYRYNLYHHDFLITPEGTAYFQKLLSEGKITFL